MLKNTNPKLLSSKTIRPIASPDQHEMERVAILGEANWGKYLNQGLQDGFTGGASGAAMGGVTGAIGGLGVGAAPGALAGGVAGGIGGFLTGVIGEAGNDVLYNFKSLEDKSEAMAKSLMQELYQIAQFVGKTDPQKAQELAQLGTQFKDYIESTVKQNDKVSLKDNVFQPAPVNSPVSSPVVSFAQPLRIAIAGPANWIANKGIELGATGMASAGMGAAMGADPNNMLEDTAHNVAANEIQNTAEGLVKKQINKGTGSVSQYLARGFNPSLAAGEAAGAGAVGGLGAVALPAAAGIAAGMGASWLADQANNKLNDMYYGGDAGQIEAHLGNVNKMTAAMEQLLVTFPQAEKAVTYLQDQIARIMSKTPSATPQVQASARKRRFAQG